nr:zinc finger, CCHC-type [Tanacetum cinerariifolium]
MSSFVLCVGCGEPLYGFSPCRWCTCEQCGIDLVNGFCPLCNSRNSCAYDPNPNSFDYPPDPYHPPHPTYETYSGDSCGIDSHPGYDCPPQFSLNYEPEPGYIQNYNSYPHDSPSFPQQCLCCDNCGGKAHSGGSLRFKSRGKTGKLKCFICHLEGDLKREYLMKKSSGFVNKGKRSQDSDSSNNEGNAYFAEALEVVRNDEMTELVMDSGGSYHMTHKRDFLYDYKFVDGGSIQLADNRTCTIKRIRKVKIQFHDRSSFILEDVRYVAGLRRSLISLGTLKRGLYCEDANRLKQLGLGVKTGIHEVHVDDRVWFELELQRAQGNHETKVFHVSNDDDAVD